MNITNENNTQGLKKYIHLLVFLTFLAFMERKHKSEPQVSTQSNLNLSKRWGEKTLNLRRTEEGRAEYKWISPDNIRARPSHNIITDPFQGLGPLINV